MGTLNGKTCSLFTTSNQVASLMHEISSLVQSAANNELSIFDLRNLISPKLIFIAAKGDNTQIASIYMNIRNTARSLLETNNALASALLELLQSFLNARENPSFNSTSYGITLNL